MGSLSLEMLSYLLDIVIIELFQEGFYLCSGECLLIFSHNNILSKLQ